MSASKTRKIIGGVILVVGAFIGATTLGDGGIGVFFSVFALFAIVGLLVIFIPSAKKIKESHETSKVKAQEQQVQRQQKEQEQEIQRQQRAKEQEVQKQQKEEEQLQKTQEKLAEDKKPLQAFHLSGLPIAPKVMCTVNFGAEALCIDGSGLRYELPYNRIIHMQTGDASEVHKQYVSSIGGAVAGGALFGPLGAVVGGRAKEKESVTYKYYFVVTYDRAGEIQYLSFEMYNPGKYRKYIEKVEPFFLSRDTGVTL